MTGSAEKPLDEGAPQIGTAVKQGYIWNLLNFGVSQGAGILIFLVLSRALTPAMFGVFALAAALVDLIGEWGRWASIDAITQRRSYSSAALSSAFLSVLAICLGLAVIFTLSAAPLAWLADEQALTYVLPPLAATLLLMPAMAVMDALVIRRLDFRAQAIRSMVGTIFGGATGLMFAFSPALEWALVAQRWAAALVTLVVLFVFTRWRPTWEFDWHEAREFLQRALRLWVATILSIMHWRVTQAAVGLRAGVSALGILTVAQRFETALHGPLTGPVQALWVPVLSALRADKDESWRLFLRLSQLTSFLTLPAFVGLGLVGRDVVAVALDERYALAGNILLVIGLQGFTIPLGFFSNLVFAGLDRSDLSLKFSLAQLCAITPAVWLVAVHGPFWAQSVALLLVGLTGLAATWVQVRLMSGSISELARTLRPAYVSGLVMVLVVVGLKMLLPLPVGGFRLICLVLAGVLAYGGWILLFHRHELITSWRLMSSMRAAGTSS